MLKKVIFAGTSILMILAGIILIILNYKGLLFHSMPWLVWAAIFLGVMFGILRGMRFNALSRISKYKVERHTIDSFLAHWGTAAGILILIISGFFIEASYKRIFSMNLHFLGLITAFGFGTYFLVLFFIFQKYSYLLPGIADIINGTIKKYLLRMPWKDTGKYLSSQKTSFLVFSILGIGLILTGAVKLCAYYFSVPLQINHFTTSLHDYLARLFVLILIIHILFVLMIRSNRSLLISLFTGKIKASRINH